MASGASVPVSGDSGLTAPWRFREIASAEAPQRKNIATGQRVAASHTRLRSVAWSAM